LRSENVSWCDQGYAWVEQDAVGWFYIAALLLVVLPYVIIKAGAWAKGASRMGTGKGDVLNRQVDGRPNLPSS
jgi:hypothetical protein